MPVASFPLSLLGLGARSYFSIGGVQAGMEQALCGSGSLVEGMTHYVALSTAAGWRPFNSISLLSAFVSPLCTSVTSVTSVPRNGSALKFKKADKSHFLCN